jgi:hypothetical protein
MVRKFACAVFALLVCIGVLIADEMKGKVTKVDAEKGVITLKVGEKDKNVKVGKDTKLTGAKKVGDIKVGDDVTVTYTKEGKKMTIQEVKVGK